MGDRPPSSFDSDAEFFDKPWKKFVRRLKEEPLIPIGVGATCYALYRAFRSMKAKDSAQLNRMFRARIYAQAFTLLAVLGGSMYYKSERAQRKELEKAMEAKQQQSKRDAWLRELEIRDQEDKDWRERHASVEKAAKEASDKGVSVREPLKSSKEENSQNTEQVPTGEKPGEAANSEGVLDAVKKLVGGSK